LSASGGSTVNTPCAAAGSADADWNLRSTGPGVVWAHDFRSDSEVNAFRWQGSTGNAPSIANTDGNCRRITSDGITGTGCLEINIPTGGTCASGWWRPMSPFRKGDNGKTTDDPGANGTITPRAWNSANTTQTYDFRGGYYGHNDYHTASWQGHTNVWDGTDFYLQFRVKMPASRWQPTAPYNPYGKLVFIDITGETGDGEIVIQSSDSGQQYWSKTTPFRMYTSRGSNPNSMITSPQGGNQGASIQPGSPYASTCTIGGNVKVAGACWEWPADEWVTILVHVIPGHQNDGVIYESDLSKWPHHDAGIEVWAARWGATKIEITLKTERNPCVTSRRR